MTRDPIKRCPGVLADPTLAAVYATCIRQDSGDRKWHWWAPAITVQTDGRKGRVHCPNHVSRAVVRLEAQEA